MKLTNSIIVVLATFNLALGAPVAEQKSRAVIAKDAVKRAATNNPYLASNYNAEGKRNTGSRTPRKLRSVLNLIGKRSASHLYKRYGYGDTPLPGSVEKLDKRYGYGDTPLPGSVENLSKE
jgi:hypothetical protein